MKPKFKTYRAACLGVIFVLPVLLGLVPETDGSDPGVASADIPLSELPGLYVGDPKLMDMILARILSRKGLYAQSLKLYQSLRRRYPDDEEIWEDYIETLVNFRDFEPALAELRQLLRNHPSNLRARRILARVYLETGRIKWTFPVYENILRQYRDDVGIWSDYAHARLNARDWDRALTYFGSILETDPENAGAVRSVQAIVREHTPYFKMDNSLRRMDDGSRTEHLSLRYGRHLTADTRLILDLHRIHIDRSIDIENLPSERTLHDLMIQFHSFINSRLMAIFGGGLDSGPSPGGSVLAGIEFKFSERVFMKWDAAYQRLWHDPIEAAQYQGRFDRFRVSVNWNIDENWGVYIETDVREYGLEEFNDFGTERNLTGILTCKLLTKPDLMVGYAFHRSLFDYDNEELAAIPFSMIESESIHSLYANFSHRPCKHWRYALSSGIRRDTSRSVNSWYVFPGVHLRLGNRTETHLNYEYVSESADTSSGETHTFRFGVRFLF